MAQPFIARMDLTNDGAKPFVLYAEPWGQDFTLMPGKSFSLLASSETDTPYFAQLSDDTSPDISIYLEGPDDISFVVMEGDRELRCGHNRQEAPFVSLPNISLQADRER